MTPTHDDIVYAAGFFDADGHISIGRRKSRGKIVAWQFSAGAGVSSSDYAILAWLKERFGGYIGSPQYRTNPVVLLGQARTLWGAPARQWVVNHRSLRPFLAAILPHVKGKRVLVVNAMKFLEAVGTQGGFMKGLPPAIYAEQEHRYNRHKELSARLKKMRGVTPKEAA